MPLYITIEGGDLRNVNSERDLVLDASGSLDPNEKLDNQRHLILTWWCDQAEFFCRHHVTKGYCSIVFISSQPVRIHLNMKNFKQSNPTKIF